MRILEATLFLVVVSTIQASHLGVGLVGPGTHGIVLQGPSSKTSLLGPDGSHIFGIAAGGTVVAPPQHGGVVSAAVAPGYVAAGHGIVGYPAGHGIVGIPAGHGIVGIAGGHLVGAGSGHEGQYVPDYTEHLYDDGSYKGDYYEGHY